MYICICTQTYMCICTHIYMYIYIYISMFLLFNFWLYSRGMPDLSCKCAHADLLLEHLAYRHGVCLHTRAVWWHELHICLPRPFTCPLLPAQCNILQHTLQHTATHCKTHCSTLQLTAKHCNTLQQTAPHYNSSRHFLRLPFPAF